MRSRNLTIRQAFVWGLPIITRSDAVVFLMLLLSCCLDVASTALTALIGQGDEILQYAKRLFELFWLLHVLMMLFSWCCCYRVAWIELERQAVSGANRLIGFPAPVDFQMLVFDQGVVIRGGLKSCCRFLDRIDVRPQRRQTFPCIRT